MVKEKTGVRASLTTLTVGPGSADDEGECVGRNWDGEQAGESEEVAEGVLTRDGLDALSQ